MYEEFLESFCKHHEIDKESALKLAIVQEFIKEKDRIDEEEKQVSSEEK